MIAYLEYFFAKFLILFSTLLPKRAIFSLFKNLSILLFFLDKKRKKLTINNLKNLYPQKDEKSLLKLAKEVYIETSKTLSESVLILTNRVSKEKLIESIDDSDMKKVEIKKDRATILIAGHFGAWEMLPHYFAIKGYEPNVIAREGNNSLIEQNITLPTRSRFGTKTIYKKRAGVSVLKALKNSEMVGILIDQKAGAKNGVLTDFFGKKCYSTKLIANLKLKLDIDIHAVFMAREADGLKLIVSENIDYRADEVDSKDKKIELMSENYNRYMEEAIKKYPTQWFWMHNRWKL